MKRKVVQQGDTTLFISLPRAWVKQQSIRKGDSLSIEIENPYLIISSTGVVREKQTTVSITSETESSIRTLIANPYRKGFETVTVHFTTQNQLLILEEVLQRYFIGFEIDSIGEGFCKIKSITEPSSEQYVTMVKKLFRNIHLLIDLTLEPPTHITASYQDVENRIVRYDNLCKRLLLKGSVSSDQALHYAFLTLINHGNRELYKLHLIKNDALDQELIALLQLIKQLFENLQQAYENKDVLPLAHVHELEKTIVYEKGHTLLDTLTGIQRRYLYHILASARQFYQANSPLTGILNGNAL